MVTQNNGLSCIIPFYNEGGNLLSVVGVISQVKGIDQIICVDGGSTDGMSDLLRHKFSNIVLLRLKKKGGKSEDFGEGVKLVTNENIFMLDADLRNLDEKEISSIISKFRSDPLIDVIILRERGGNNWLDRIQRKEIIFSGNRVMKKTDIEEIMKLKPKGYRLEVVMNEYLMSRNKKVYWVDSKIRNVHKIQKWGIVEGMKRSALMELDLFMFLGPINYFREILFFCQKKISV